MASTTQMIRRRRSRKSRRAAELTRSRLWTILSLVVVLILIGGPAALLVGGAAVVYVQAVGSLQNPADTTFVGAVSGPTQLYDRSGNTLIYAVEDPLGDSRTWLSLDDLPPYVIDTMLQVEDPDFLTAANFNAVDTLVTLWRNIAFGPIAPDSSLTGRLVRNIIAPTPDIVQVEDRNREIALIAEINRLYSPEFVLEWHLNTNYYGNEAYGIEAASQVYLGKSARDLTLDEAALLASIPTAPQYNPIDDETAARGRQSDTLRRLLVDSAISEAQYEQANGVVTTLLPNAGQVPEIAADFAIYARRQAEEILRDGGLDGGRLVSREGLRITTTLDLDLYYQVDCALGFHLARLNNETPPETARDGSPCDTATTLINRAVSASSAAPDQGAVVVIDPVTGEIKAMVGAATRDVYQPGPTLLPFAYFEGFREQRQDTQFNPATMLLDIPLRFPGTVADSIYLPVNPDNQFSGPVSLREAAAIGLVPPAVEVADNHGMINILRTAHRLGLNTLDQGFYDLSLLARGGNVSVLDVSYAYSVLATMGDMYGIPTQPQGVGFRNRNPVAVARIEDAEGNLLWEYTPETNQTNVFSDFRELGFLINDVLADRDVRTQKFGEDTPLNTSHPTAVIHGLTADRIDNWTVGYSPQMVVAVHLDRSDSAPMSLAGYGLNGAATLWNAIMEHSHRGLPVVEWSQPGNITEAVVCERSGMLPHPDCPTRREIFISGIQPTQTDTHWRSFEINNRTGQLATVNTPQSQVVSETYFVPPDEAMDWWRANNQRVPPQEFDTLSRPDDFQFQSTLLTQPAELSWVRGQVPIQGIVDIADLDYYQLRYSPGAGLPNEWFDIGTRQTQLADDGVLGIWDTTGLDSVYTIELFAVSQTGIPQRDRVQVRVDNLPPTVVVRAGESGKIYRWPDEQVIPITAEVNDNLFVDRVEFYQNDQLIRTLNESPFSFDVNITGVGSTSFYAVAFDAAGNQTTSAAVQVEVIR